jgi:hypothetical protein
VVIDRYSPLYFNREEFGIRNLRPFGYASLCYQGLSAAERMRICYHFEADLPQGNHLPYEMKLWEAIVNWNLAFAAGARLYQFQATTTTLIVDTRRERRRCFLLSGSSHHLYDLLRTARTPAAVAKGVASPGTAWPEQSFEDVELAYIGALLEAEPIASPEQPHSFGSIMETLDRECLVENIDGRWLALAVDCTDTVEAARFGLEKFARVHNKVRQRLRNDVFTDSELIQILEGSSRAT